MSPAGDQDPDPPGTIPAKPPAGVTHPIAVRALRDLGRVEGDPAIPFASPHKAWCAIWMSTVLRDCGVPITATWSAIRLLARLGRWSIPHAGPLVEGDIVGWHRRNARRAIVGGHVACVLAANGEQVIVVAGNSSAAANQVAVTQVPKARIEYAARPLTVE